MGETPNTVINVAGHTSGILIFATFLFLVLRQNPVRQRNSRLAVWAGVLALTWNLASLAVISASAASMFTEVLAAIGFSSLSVLPAVLLHVSLGGEQIPIVRAGYALSGIAVVSHCLEMVGGPAYLHRAGLGLITLGFGLLTVVTVVRVTWRGAEDPRRMRSRLLAAMSLFLFAISFVHFSEGASHEAWSTEVAFHHAGIPLALFILIQDYRFVLVDAFLRFLANGLLAAVFGSAIVLALPRFETAGQIVIAGIALASFAVARGAVMRFLTRIVFRQTDPDQLIEELRALGQRNSNQAQYLRAAAHRVATALDTELVDAKLVSLSEDTDEPSKNHRAVFPTLAEELSDGKLLQSLGVAVVVPIRLSNGEMQEIHLGTRRGGRRYLSQDLETLARLAACLSDQIEQMRESELRQLVSRAELRALQAQIHPHFLFNALNTLYGIIPRQAAGARATLLNLSEILRYLLRPETTYVPLEEELRVVRSYLAIEGLRLGDKLKVQMIVDDGVLHVPIPVLSIEPLIENAVQHGIAPQPEGGEIRLEAKRADRGLSIRVADSGQGFDSSAGSRNGHSGIGLENVRRRLELCYGPAAAFELRRQDGYTVASFLVPLPAASAAESLEGPGVERIGRQ